MSPPSVNMLKEALRYDNQTVQMAAFVDTCECKITSRIVRIKESISTQKLSLSLQMHLSTLNMPS
jgi:hypothetical protein